MKRVVLPTLGVMAAMLALAPISAAAASAARARHISDRTYAISFTLPATWKQPKITTPRSGATKLEVEDLDVGGTVALVQVEVFPGRQISAADIAKGILTTPGASVLGSRLERFSIGEAEQLTFSLQAPGDPLVYGTVEAFFRGGRSYYVAFDAPYRSVANAALRTVMATWGT